MEYQMKYSPNELKVNCNFTWIVGHNDRTTPAHDEINGTDGFKVNA